MRENQSRREGDEERNQTVDANESIPKSTYTRIDQVFSRGYLTIFQRGCYVGTTLFFQPVGTTQAFACVDTKITPIYKPLPTGNEEVLRKRWISGNKTSRNDKSGSPF